PPPRPPQSTIPQLTSLLINNAGALPPGRRKPTRFRPRMPPSLGRCAMDHPRRRFHRCYLCHNWTPVPKPLASWS
ncbi:hypothetical protein OSH39_23595, partial [Mycobacterium ulcerans]|nr:hypothetical protein [Mycobacterium ulcerans]MEB4054704.1 hypothetical protein [Mycobacterium ulcerans]MEB4108529.1 hypothetical protein [Mycobacterium ulcerans]MEB4170543.1 hypothetical protein [Mycobacterium ulcerans]